LELVFEFSRDIEMQRTILKAQLERELEARSVASGSEARIVLSDRSAIDPVVYAVITAANEEDERHRKRALVDTPEFQATLRWYQEGTFILFKPVSEWLVDDGVRSMDERGQNLEVFRGMLRELEIPFVELGEEIKDLQSRVAFAKGLMVRSLFSWNCVKILISRSLPCRSENLTMRDLHNELPKSLCTF
jgi:nicotinamide riboside kinase